MFWKKFWIFTSFFAGPDSRTRTWKKRRSCQKHEPEPDVLSHLYIGVTLKEDDIDIVHRINTRDDVQDETNKKIPSIILRVKSRELRNEVFDSRKKLRDIQKHHQVYINDHVTPLRSRIMYELRNRNEKKMFKYV